MTTPRGFIELTCVPAGPRAKLLLRAESIASLREDSATENGTETVWTVVEVRHVHYRQAYYVKESMAEVAAAMVAATA